jgi:hypothetical protein
MEQQFTHAYDSTSSMDTCPSGGAGDDEPVSTCES